MDCKRSREMENNEMTTNKENWTAVKPKVYEEIAQAIEGCAIYEPNNSETWDRVNVVVNNLLSEYSDFLSAWNVICNDTVNTQEVVEKNQFHLKFCWKIEPEDEWSIVEFVLSPHGIEIK